MEPKEKAIALLKKADLIQVDDVFTDNHEFNSDSENLVLDVSIMDFYNNPVSYSFDNESFENCVISGNVISMTDKDGDEVDIYCYNLLDTKIEA